MVTVLDRASVGVNLDNGWLETALGRIDPILSLRTVRARVRSVIHETPDTNTYWLRPNARFGSHRESGASGASRLSSGQLRHLPLSQTSGVVVDVTTGLESKLEDELI
jgi:hypothetical protein